ncbi:MAG TPA: sulfite exporter TauE/SafE family protein [Rhizobiaceae bacterium]|nr:sulfite exporter TauE/SafE family protein [Rhizobiaceae bacterium]
MLSLPVDIPSLVFLLFSAAAAGLARGFSGFGSALIFVPLASTAVGPLVAVPLLLVVDGITTLGLVAPAARLANRTDVARMALGALMGVPTGVWLLSRLDPLIIRWSIVAIVILLLALLMSGWRYRNQPKPPVTIAVGAVSGLLTGIAQIGGPPVIAYWLGGAVSAIVMRANFILYFAISTVLSAVGYVWSGLVTAEVLILAACMAPLYAIGVWLGSRMFGMASELTFRRICYAMIAAAAVFSMPILDGLLR